MNAIGFQCVVGAALYLGDAAATTLSPDRTEYSATGDASYAGVETACDERGKIDWRSMTVRPGVAAARRVLTSGVLTPTTTTSAELITSRRSVESRAPM